MGYKHLNYEDSVFLDIALRRLFLDEVLEWNREALENYKNNKQNYKNVSEFNLTRWNEFIKIKKLGLEYQFIMDGQIDHTGYVADWHYTITDSKAWFLTKIKYGLTFRNIDEKE